MSDATVLSAALRQNEEMLSKLAEIDEDVSKLAKLMVDDGVQPSGRWGSAHEMLSYLIEHETRRKYYAVRGMRVSGGGETI